MDERNEKLEMRKGGGGCAEILRRSPSLSEHDFLTKRHLTPHSMMKRAMSVKEKLIRFRNIFRMCIGGIAAFLYRHPSATLGVTEQDQFLPSIDFSR